MNSNLQESFLQLVRLGTGTVHEERFLVHDSNDWYALKNLADKQGLSAVVLDGVDKLPADKRAKNGRYPPTQNGDIRSLF